MVTKALNTLIWGFDTTNTVKIIEKMENDVIITPKLWIKDSSPKTTITCESISYNSLCIQNKFTVTKQVLSLSDIRSLEHLILDFVLINSRHQCFKYPLESVITRNIYDDYHLFYRLVHYFAQKIKDHNIQLILFSNLPHEGADYVLYHVAKHMNINTILFYQTLFKNKCFCINNIHDLTQVNQKKIILSNPIEFKKETFLTKQFYMNTIDSAENQKEELESLFSTEEFLKKNRLLFLKYLITGNYRKISSILDSKGPGSRINKLKTYINNHNKHVRKNVDLNQKYVYFPLHLQPELTTDTLGNSYRDQIRAIEDLAQWIPSDVKIYIKENPKQWETHRPPDFFDRINSLSQVVLVDRQLDSLTLIEQALFTATITGTAGWESILSGKNTLTFGYAWYNTLPGVFEFSSNPSYKDLVSHKINPETLKQSVETFSSYLSDGVIDDAYISILPDYCPIKNATTITKSITKLLNA